MTTTSAEQKLKEMIEERKKENPFRKTAQEEDFIEDLEAILSAIQQDRAELVKWLQEERNKMASIEVEWIEKYKAGYQPQIYLFQANGYLKDAFDAVIKHLQEMEK